MSNDIPLNDQNSSNSSSSSSTSSSSSSSHQSSSNTVQDFVTLFEQLKKLANNKSEIAKASKEFTSALAGAFTDFIPDINTAHNFYAYPFTFTSQSNSENKSSSPSNQQECKVSNSTNVIKYDLIDRGASYIYKFYLPGHEKANIDVSVTDNKLTVCSKRNDNQENVVAGSTQEFVVTESDYGSFMRVVSLPKNVDENVNVESSFNNGILQLVFQKQAKSQPKKIIVQ